MSEVSADQDSRTWFGRRDVEGVNGQGKTGNIAGEVCRRIGG